MSQNCNLNLSINVILTVKHDEVIISWASLQVIKQTLYIHSINETLKANLSDESERRKPQHQNLPDDYLLVLNCAKEPENRVLNGQSEKAEQKGASQCTLNSHTLPLKKKFPYTAHVFKKRRRN